MWNIIIGVLLIIAGLSGRFAMIGTGPIVFACGRCSVAATHSVP